MDRPELPPPLFEFGDIVFLAAVAAAICLVAVLVVLGY
jgi:hypothetical protein